MKNKNKKLLKDFIKYCEEHPEERFWQALSNWVGFKTISIGEKKEREDTFYFEEKDK